MFGFASWKGRQTNQALEDLLDRHDTPIERILDQEGVKSSVNLPTVNSNK